MKLQEARSSEQDTGRVSGAVVGGGRERRAGAASGAQKKTIIQINFIFRRSGRATQRRHRKAAPSKRSEGENAPPPKSRRGGASFLSPFLSSLLLRVSVFPPFLFFGGAVLSLVGAASLRFLWFRWSGRSFF